MPIQTFDIDRDRRTIDVAKEIALLEPDDSPFTVILMRARKKAANGAEIVWFDDKLGALWTQINYSAGYNTSADDLTVDDNSIFAPYDVVKVARTGEVMLVTEIGDSNVITVLRGYGTTSAANINNDDWLVILGNAMKEGSNAPAEKLSQPTKHNNYCQIFRTVFSVTGTEEAEGVITNESERARLTRKEGLKHRLMLEHAILFGEKKEDTVTAAAKRRMMGGLLSYISSNVYNVSSGILTESEFELCCEQIFAYGSANKLLVASPRLLTVISRWAVGKLEVLPKADTYGVSIRRYISAHGTLDIVPSKTLRNAYSGWGFFVDLDNIKYRPLRDTKLKRNIQQNDEDAVRDEYFTEATLEVRLEKTHGVIKGVVN
jgi:hypothetical protein